MKVIRTVAEMRAVSGGDLGFVPTMGAFHEGHLSLMREARARHERLCVSIFVNPLQFGPGEDLAKYPRQESRDLDLARREGVDVVFAPTTEAMYLRAGTVIHVGDITQRWEGAYRPGHFDGVATVVAKLLHIVDPATSYFGWKDFQQCLVIRQMVEDLNFPGNLVFLETVREHDGLAMSSRNAYLNADERAVAPLLFATLGSLAKLPEITSESLEAARGRLELSGFDVDYLGLVDTCDMLPNPTAGDAALIAAARLGTTRLIDNIRFTLP